MKLIGLSGKSLVGKDTLADHLAVKYNLVKISLADPVKRIAQQVYNFSYDQLWGNEKDLPDFRYPTYGKENDFLLPRDTFKQFGNGARDLYLDTWIDLLFSIADEVLTEEYASYSPERGVFYTETAIHYDGIIVPDVRFENCLTLIQAEGGCVYRVKKNVKTDKDISEAGQDLINDDKFDGLLVNDASKSLLFEKGERLVNSSKFSYHPA